MQRYTLFNKDIISILYINYLTLFQDSNPLLIFVSYTNVLIRQTGCMGLCHSEPTVEVVVPGMPAVIYGNVDAATAREVVEKHIVGRQLIEGKILDKPSIDIVKEG